MLCKFTCYSLLWDWSDKLIEGFGQHPGEENSHHCQTCGKCYKSKGSLATHVSLSHGKNESNGQSFACSICGKPCNSKNALNIHKSRYHKSSQDQCFNW